jgi:MoaA/NifB/PqqE/SkfB family radical SAM enzyme
MMNPILYRAAKYFVSYNPWMRKHIAALALKSGCIPQILTIAATYKCQCSCVHCGIESYKQNSRQELSTEEIGALIREASKIRSIVQVTFTGGESLLRSDLFDLIKTAKNEGFFTKIDSNGFLLTETNLTLLKKAGIDRIDISIDHYEPSIHDRLRKCEGLFNTITDALRICVALSVPCYLQTYATRENLHSGALEGIIRYAKQSKATRLKMQPAALSGRFASSPDMLLEHDDFLLLSELVKKYPFAYLENEFLDPADYLLMCQLGIRGNIYVTAYGDIFPCCFAPLSFGNVQREPLRQILRNMYKNEQFIGLTKYKECICASKAFQSHCLRTASKGL